MKTPLVLSTIPVLALTACSCAMAAPVNQSTVIITTTTVSSSPVAQTETFETMRLGLAIDIYQRESTLSHAATVRDALADLAIEIAKLQARIDNNTGPDRDRAAAKLKNLESYRDAEAARFVKMQAAAASGFIPLPDDRSGAQKVADGAKIAGFTVGNIFKKTGRAIGDAARKTGESLGHAAEKTSEAVKSVAQ